MPIPLQPLIRRNFLSAVTTPRVIHRRIISPLRHLWTFLETFRMLPMRFSIAFVVGISSSTVGSAAPPLPCLELLPWRRPRTDSSLRAYRSPAATNLHRVVHDLPAAVRVPQLASCRLQPDIVVALVGHRPPTPVASPLHVGATRTRRLTRELAVEEDFGAVSLSETDPETSYCHIALSSATAAPARIAHNTLA